MNITLHRIQQLLAVRGEKAAQMLRELDIKQSTYYTWVHEDRLPATEYLLPIAQYLGTTADYLLGAEEDNNEYYLDPKAKEMANALNDNPGQRVLFDAAKDLPPEDILKVLDFIQQQNKKEGRD